MGDNEGRPRRLTTWVERVAGAAVAVALAALVVVAVIHDWSAEAWAALAAWTTAAVAIAAGLVAIRQLGETRRLRLEQAQPYVVAYMEPSAAEPMIIELIVRNFGMTAAHDVGIEIEPGPLRKAGASGDDAEPLWVPNEIPVLVPGQEWRTLWDTGMARFESGLPDRHEAVVRFNDSQGRPLPPLRSVLDWSAYWQREPVAVYGAHHATKALRDISATIKKWREEASGGLAVFVRDGDAKDERARERAEARRAARVEDNREAAS